MGRIIVIFILVVSLLSCNSKKSETNTLQYNLLGSFDNNKISTTEEEPKRQIPESPLDIIDANYQLYGKLKPGYEIGYDEYHHAFLTDTRTNLQIVFLCDEIGDYSKYDFLWIYEKAIKEDLDLKEKLADKIEDLKPYAQKQETVYSDHFKANITRYFVSYKAVYGHFHI